MDVIRCLVVLNLNFLRETLSKLSYKKYLIAFSGGLDSSVLLHLMANWHQQDPNIHVTAIHVNHHLSPNAAIWMQDCLEVCALLKIPCIIENVEAKPNANESPEAAAREVRYAALAKHLFSDTLLLTAHTQDDQAETVLLQLLRGSGVKGLSAMPILMPFAKSFLARPLLTISRIDVADYAAQQKLTWVEDESNQQLRYDRNYVRHKIMPLLQARWPQAHNTLSRVAKHCASADELLTELAEQDWLPCKGTQKNTLSCQKLLILSQSRRFNLLRHWLQAQQFLLPSTAKLKQIELNVLHAKPDAEPLVSWDKVQVRRYRDDLYALALTNSGDTPLNISWDLQSALKLPGSFGTLIATLQIQDGLYLPLGMKLNVRFRRGGERCHPAGRSGSRSLKKLMQEWEIPPWRRNSVPLLYLEDELVGVVGHCIIESRKACAEQVGWNISLLESD